MKKDRWIQRAKALLYDFILLAEPSLRNLKDEAQELIDAGGGYEADYEDSESSLVWTAQDRQTAEKRLRRRATKKTQNADDLKIARQRLSELRADQRVAEPEDWDSAVRTYYEGKPQETRYYKDGKEITA